MKCSRRMAGLYARRVWLFGKSHPVRRHGVAWRCPSRWLPLRVLYRRPSPNAGRCRRGQRFAREPRPRATLAILLPGGRGSVSLHSYRGWRTPLHGRIGPEWDGQIARSFGTGAPATTMRRSLEAGCPQQEQGGRAGRPAVRLARCPQDGAVRRRRPITLWSVLASGKTRTLDVGETGRAHPDWLKNGSRRP